MLLFMIEAAKEEIPSSFLAWCADPASAARMVNLEKSHQGIAPEKSALLLGQPVCNSTTALGLRGLAALDRVGSRCTGKERDSESGLDDFGARYYASAMARFMTPDWTAGPNPVPYASFGDPQTLNLYGYVRNNPLSKADLDGHGWWDKLKNSFGDAECWCEGKKAEEAAKKNIERRKKANEEFQRAINSPVGRRYMMFFGIYAAAYGGTAGGAALTSGAEGGVLASANYGQRTYSQP